MAYYGNTRPSFWQSIPTVTRNLLLINIIVFVASYIDETLLHDDYMVRMFALFYPASPLFHWWQPVTHMFMHGNFWHLFFNMYSLLIFGAPVERALGERRYLLFYFLCGFGAVALHLVVQYLQLQHFLVSGSAGAYSLLRTPTVGASGAIYGILIGFAMLNPEATLVLLFPPIPLKAKWWAVIFVVIELFTGIAGTSDGVAHFAHLGGILIGFLLIGYWRKTGKLYR